MIIISAKYGINNKKIDILKKVKRLILKGNFCVNNKNFGDPAPKKKKKLYIKYNSGGKIFSEIIEENKIFFFKKKSNQSPKKNSDKYKISKTFSTPISYQHQSLNSTVNQKPNIIHSHTHTKKLFDDFKNIHKEQDIYVIGSGKSLDFINKDFFNNKITIGINQVYKKIKCKYLIKKDIVKNDKIFDNIQNTKLFLSEGKYGGNNKKNKEYIYSNKINLENIIFFPHNPNTRKMPDILPQNKLIVSYSTITSGIHLAALMGAKNIIICAHDCCNINNESNFKGYHDKKIPNLWKSKEEYDNWLKNIESQTIKLKKMLIPNFNCNILSLNPFINFNLENNKLS